MCFANKRKHINIFILLQPISYNFMVPIIHLLRKTIKDKKNDL